MRGVFNIRVYGLMIDSLDRVLMVNESFKEIPLLKFPGGGLKYGEGTHQCLIREFQEELSIAINIDRHFYTTETFQPSAFHKDQQIISIYYIVSASESNLMNNKDVENGIDLNWQGISELNIEDITMPIDKKVGEMLKDKFLA